MTTEKINLNRDQYLLDIFTTALEGGIGYWSYALNYHWQTNGLEDLRGFYSDIVVPISDLPNDYPIRPDTMVQVDLPLAGPTTCVRFRIDRKVIAKGMRLGATTPEEGNYFWQCDGRPPLVITADTEWDYDAYDADAIVQYGLFGKVVYG